MHRKLLTANDVRKLLRARCEAMPSTRAWAAKHGLSQPYISQLLSGSRDPGDKVLAALGLRRIVRYQRESQ